MPDSPRRLVLSSAVALALAACLPGLHAMSTVQPSSPSTHPELKVRSTEDFTVNGRGDAPAWKSVDWNTMNVRQDVNDAYATRFKILYSTKGIYVLMDAADKKLTSS